MTRIHFIDTETTGLTPGKHVPWEVAQIIYDTERELIVDVDTWQLPVTVQELDRAEPIALEIGRWEERRYADLSDVTSAFEFMAEFLVTFKEGDHWAGAMPWFDEAMLIARFDTWSDRPEPWSPLVKSWHYHLIDVENQALGYAAGERRALEENGRICSYDAPTVPWKHVQIMEALGIPTISDDMKHTALGDATSALTAYVWMHEGPDLAAKVMEALS